MLRAILLAFLLAASGVVVLGDYQSARAAWGDDYDAGDHLRVRAADLKAVAGTLAAPLTGAPDLAAALPPAPDGWSVRRATMKDGWLVARVDPNGIDSQFVQRIDAETYGAMGRHGREMRLYAKGDGVVLVDLTWLPPETVPTEGARLLASFFEMFGARGEILAGTAEGPMPLRITSMPGRGGDTLVVAGRIGGQLYLSASSSASPEETAALLAGLDNSGLASLVTVDQPQFSTRSIPVLMTEIAMQIVQENPQEAIRTVARSTCEQRGAGVFCAPTGANP